MLASGRLSKLMPGEDRRRDRDAVDRAGGADRVHRTTTLTNVFEEDANRCLMLQTDETPAQTSASSVPWPSAHGRARDTDRVTPRPPHAAAAAAALRGARAVVGSAGRGVQLRARGGAASVPATPHPGAGVRAAPPQAAGARATTARYSPMRGITTWRAGSSSGRSRNRWVVGCPNRLSASWRSCRPANEFTSKEIAKKLKVSKSSAAGWLAELHDAGAVEVTEQGRAAADEMEADGQDARRGGGRAPDRGEHLPANSPDAWTQAPNR